MNTDLTGKVIDFLKDFYSLKKNEVAVKDGKIVVYIHSVSDFNREYIHAEFDGTFTTKYFTPDLIKLYENNLRRSAQYFANQISNDLEEHKMCLTILGSVIFRSQNMIWLKKKVKAQMLVMEASQYSRKYDHSIYVVGLHKNPHAKNIREIVAAAIQSYSLSPIKALIEAMPIEVARDFHRNEVTQSTTKKIWQMLEDNQKMHNLSFVFETEQDLLNITQSSLIAKKGTVIYPIDLETGKIGKGSITLKEDCNFTTCQIKSLTLI